MKYNNIFQKGRIGSLELKNKILMPAMGTGLASETGEANDAIIKYYEERAKAGCGLIITEIARVDQDTGIGLRRQLQLIDRRVIPSLKKLADAVHRHGSKIMVQLQHPGRQLTSNSLEAGKKIVAPSPVACKVMREVPQELSLRNIQVIISRFAIAAKIAQDAGIDGVELHAAHGYLISQFMSPNTNLRNDKYGGNIYNRLNFLKEIIEGIRQFCGEDFPIIVRMNGDDFVEGGLELDEAVEMAKIIESFGVDALNVSCGNYESTHTIIEPISYKEGWKKHLSKTIKENVDLPVIACNTLRNPKTADKMIEEGVSDFVALGRAQLADSQWVKKASQGLEEEIRPCISCLYCIENVMQQKPIKCAVNPRLGLEYKYPLESESRLIDKSALVIGGGPAGLEAAICLRKKGYNVRLLEKEARLGGSVYIGSIPNGKEKLKEFIDSMELECRHLGVDIKLNTKVNLEEIKSYKADSIYLAIGGKSIIPDIPGIEKDRVILASNLLKERMDIRDCKIAVIGSGLTGMETAEYLASRDNDLAIIEMQKYIGNGVYATNRFDMIRRLESLNVAMYPKHKLIQITKSGIITENHEGKSISFDADYVILALGVKNRLADPLIKKAGLDFKNLKLIGDSNDVGQIANAMESAFKSVYE